MPTARDGGRVGALAGALLLACAVLTAAASGAGPASGRAALAGEAEQSGVALSLRIGGGKAQRVSICGRRRRATVVTQGARASARAVAGRYRRRALRRPAPARRARVLVLRVRRCGPNSARSSVLAERRLGGGRAALRAPLPTRAVTDYRVTAQVRSGRRGPVRTRRLAYLRVRDAVIDLPISFTVSNVNRSRLACQSDGRTYTIAGRLVAPRPCFASRPQRRPCICTSSAGDASFGSSRNAATTTHASRHGPGMRRS